MPDYDRYVKLNPAILARRLVAVEQAVERQFALNDAAAAKLLQLQETIAQQGAYIVALLSRAPEKRLELTIPELEEIQGSNLRAQYFYPDETTPTFRILLVADGAKNDEEVARSIEAQLRANGVSDEEIAAFRRKLDEAASEAERTFGEPPAEPTDEKGPSAS